MKTEKRFSAMLPVVAIAMSVFGQNPKREVVFTMNANEVIYANEYTLFQQFDRNRFACMTRDTVTDKCTFVFNGERIKTADDCGYQWDGDWNLYSVNPGEAKGYVFTYQDNGRWYINYHGDVDGGFDDVYCDYPFADSYGNLYTPEKGYDYLYKLAGKWYAAKNGKNKRINFIERIVKGNEEYVNINGNTIGPYETCGYGSITESGKYAYYYRKNDKYYINVNGSTIGSPKEHRIGSLTLTGSGRYAYYYWSAGKYYINVNGSTVGGPYEYDINDLTLTESGKYVYTYYDNGKYYINVNGSTVGGPYEYINYLTLTESGKYAYYYWDNDKCYINVDGSVVGGPYDGLTDLTLTEDGKYSYRFNENSKWYMNTNGVVTDSQFPGIKIWRSSDSLSLTSKDGNHSFDSSYEYEYVVIDGRPFGKSPAIEARYDESKNAFVWNAVEGRELVVYEYALK